MSNEAITVVQTRRSVRSFTDEAVSDADLELILRCAMQAPSAGGAEPWEFVILKDKALLRKFAEINPYAKFAPQADVGIVVCGNLERERFKGFWVQDTSAAMENLLLAVHALNLGGVWTGLYPVEERVKGVRELIQAPAHIIPLGCALIGHPKAKPMPKDRFDESRIHKNIW